MKLYENKYIYEVIDNNEQEGRNILKDKYESTISLITEYLESFGMYRLKE